MWGSAAAYSYGLLDNVWPCQLAGNARHVGIGSDLDGGYGREQCPYDMETIADMQSLAPILAGRGYAAEDVEAIMHGNWIRRLNDIWS